jgi:hypothetical protein
MLKMKEYVKGAIAEYGRMTEAEVDVALGRLEELPLGAFVESKYFFDYQDWLDWPAKKRRARGADFARRWANDEFPGLLAYGEPGAVIYVKGEVSE